MKSLLSTLLCILLCTVLIGCSLGAPTEETGATETTEPAVDLTVLPDDYSFPADVELHGVEIGNMSFDDAYDAISDKIEDYSLTVTINNIPRTYFGDNLGLSCSEDALYSYALALRAGEEPEVTSVLTYKEGLLEQWISKTLLVPYENAQMSYNTETELFELIPGVSGKHVQTDTLMPVVRKAIDSQRTNLTLYVTEHEDIPPISETDSEIIAALDKANTYLTTEISYSFNIEEDDFETVEISRDRILEMIEFDEELNPSINKDLLKEYAEEINAEYGQIGLKDFFITRAGAKTDLSVTYYAQALDTDALCEDILYYLDKGISGTRLPPQLEKITPEETPYRGSYIEIDLTNQVLYLFKDNECLLETPIVTGKVYRHMNTPTGVYKVLTHRMHVVLQGFDYSTYVKYWMQFYRGYGMHDAWWRDKFGGNEYLYDGSHGCVNIPPDNAEFIFNNIDKGYPVIIYGGATNDGPLQQSIVGTETYDVSIHKEPFKLDAKTAVGDGKLNYSSSNPSVASVDEEGTVTVHKVGSAIINVEYEEGRYYTGASMRVKINVDDPCGDDHIFGSWIVSIPSSCVDGESARTCINCDKKETKPLPATRTHNYSEWEVTIEPKCKPGEETGTCSICGSTTTRTLPAEHNLRDWKTREHPTCEEDGERYRSCRRCDYEETEVIPALGHTFLPDEEFCEDCDKRNPNWIPPKEDDDE